MNPDQVSNLVNSLLAQETSKIVAVTFLVVSIAVLVGMFVLYRVLSAKMQTGKTESTLALGLVKLAEGLTEHNAKFTEAIRTLEERYAQEGALNRNALQMLTNAFESQTKAEEERIRMRLKIAETDARKLEANSQAINELMVTLDDNTNAVSQFKTKVSYSLDAQSQTIVEMLDSVNNLRKGIQDLPNDIGVVIAQKLDLALQDFIQAKADVLEGLRSSEINMVKAVEDIGKLLTKLDNGPPKLPEKVPDKPPDTLPPVLIQGGTQNAV